MTWERLPPLTIKEAGFRSGCLNCGPQPTMISLDAHIAVGFGYAGVTKDGAEVWSESNIDEDPWTVADAERAAAKDPDHDWRILFHGPLSEAEYQRHEANNWVLVRKGLGFA